MIGETNTPGRRAAAHDASNKNGELAARVRAYIIQHTLIAAGDTVVAAVSGGADSLCLLYLLHQLAAGLGYHLHVAHLDHALREDSPADAAFVAAHAAALALPYSIERRDVRALARGAHLSLETAARAVRYEFLRAVATTTGAAAIATGHTRDDQAETLLLHLTRGSGLNGLAGMAPRRGDIIRPLLEVSRAETEAFCAALGLQPRYDVSNRSPAHRRNRLRHEALPLLEAIQPAARANIARAARLLAADLSLIERMAWAALDRAALMTLDRAAPMEPMARQPPGTAGFQPAPAPGRLEAGGPPAPLTYTSAVTRQASACGLHTGVAARVTLSATRWAEAESELCPHMLRLLLISLLGHADGFTERHYAALTAALTPGGPDTAISLPHGLVLARRGDVVTVGPPDTDTPPDLGEHMLPIPGVIRTTAGTLRAEPTLAPADWTKVSPHEAYLDAEAAGSSLTVRGWRLGDRVHPLGLHGTRKVQDVFVDHKTRRHERPYIPIVVGPRGIAWVAGLCVGEPYRATPRRAAVKLVWSPIEA